MNIALVLILVLFVSWTIALLANKSSYIAYKTKSQSSMKFLFFWTPPFIFGFIFVALKSFDAGGDTHAYLSSFHQINNPLTATLDADYGPEFLFWPLQAFIKLFVNARGWYAIHFILVSILYFFAYKKLTENTRLSALLFCLVFLTYYIAYGANAMRQVYSIPLGIIAFHYAYTRSNLKFLIFFLLSIAFHWSAFVLLISPLVVRIPNRNYIYLALPFLALIATPVIIAATGILTSIAGLDWLAVKVNAYVLGGRTSHISEIWLTMNFWLCVSIYSLLIALKIVTDNSYEKIMKYLLIFFCLMLLSINNADIADRYMVHFLFLTPIPIALIFSKLKISDTFKNVAFSITFVAMSVLVYTRESLISAIGLNLF
jgi:hypothetical protein